MSSASASTQTPAWATPSKSEAMASSPQPIAVLIASPTTLRRRSGSSGLARTKSAICRLRKTPIASAKARPRLSNASGTQSEATSIAAIAAKITSRVAPCSGSMTLVSQA